MLQTINASRILILLFLISLSSGVWSQLTSTGLSSWALNNPKASINLPKVDFGNFKKNITVAVIDSGVDTKHPYLRSNLILNEFNQNLQDPVGHGTHVAGIIKSVFPGVKILPIKYYDPQASDLDNLNQTVRAINFAIDLKVDIINYSAGGVGSNAQEKKALERAMDQGILVIVAAGNEGRDIDQNNNHYYPANYNLNNLIAVINYDENVNLANTSNYGKTSTHVAAPGNRIKSSYPNNRSSYLSGTSQATAFVTGLAALIKAYQPLLSYQDIKNIILQSSKKEKSLEGKCLTGARIDAASALKLARTYVRKVSFVP